MHWIKKSKVIFIVQLLHINSLLYYCIWFYCIWNSMLFFFRNRLLHKKRI